MSRRSRRIGENLYSRRFWGSMKIRDDCKNIQPLNYEVNPAELLEKFPTSPGHTFLLFSNWPCHFRLINSPLPSPTFLPRRGSHSTLFSQCRSYPFVYFHDSHFPETWIFNEISFFDEIVRQCLFFLSDGNEI